MSVSEPSHASPPFLGAGRSQTRVRERVAEPHVAEHMLQHDQKFQPPSIGTKGEERDQIWTIDRYSDIYLH